jgi:2-methylcitrate dehydratase PrpD
MDVAYTLAKYIASAKFEDVPIQAVEGAKRIILDQLAAALAGSTACGAKEVVQEVSEWGGKPESTIWVYGKRVPVVHAVFANSVMTHGWDYDDTHLPTITHTGVVTVPPAFALAERKGKLGGKELITAVNIGIDVLTRLSAGCPNAGKQGWHATTLFGSFAAAATAGHILGLSEEQMLNAFGLAYAQASGNGQCVRDGALSKRLQPGFAVKAALQGVLLAQRGVTGAQNSFEGEYGLYPVYTRGEYTSDVITAELGKRFETPNVAIKPYPG